MLMFVSHRVAVVGLVGYPALGIQKSLSAKKGRTAAVMRSKGAQVDVFAQGMSPLTSQEVLQIVGRFGQLINET